MHCKRNFQMDGQKKLIFKVKFNITIKNQALRLKYIQMLINLELHFTNYWIQNPISKDNKIHKDIKIFLN